MNARFVQSHLRCGKHLRAMGMLFALLLLAACLPWEATVWSPSALTGGASGDVCWAQEAQVGTDVSGPPIGANEPQKEAPAEETKSQPPANEEAAKTEAAPSEGTVSNVFFDTDIRQALFDVAAQAGVTIIPDESVGGNISVDLKEVPLDSALELMLAPGGFVYEEIKDGVYLVTAPDPKSPSFARIAQTQIVGLSFISSDELRLLLPEIYTPFVRFDELGNRVVVTAPRALLKSAVDAIRSLDTPPLQIMIEALVVETGQQELEESKLSLQGRHVGVSASTGLITYVDQVQQLLHQLMWLVSKEKAVIRANPRLVAQDGREATVKVANEQYFQILTGQVAYQYVTLEAIEAAINLTITPHASTDKSQVTCKIKPEVGDVTGTGPNNLPTITRRSAETTVRIGDGQVIAIGGLLQHVSRTAQRKIPFLGDLPLVGSLFRSKSADSETREIIIFIVPHILDETGNFAGPLLFDRLTEGQPVQPAEVVTPPQEDAKSEREKRRELIRERVRARRAAEEQQPAGGQ